MIRIVLGIIVGFVAWTIIWVGSDQVLASTLDWYARSQMELTAAMVNKTAFEPSSTILLINIVRSVIASVMVGYLAAIIAGENHRSTVILGALLLLVGIFVETMAWRYMPIWYHFIFLFLLIPATVTGGNLKKFSDPRVDTGAMFAAE